MRWLRDRSYDVSSRRNRNLKPDIKKCLSFLVPDIELVLVQLSFQVADERVDALLKISQVHPVAQNRADLLDLHERLICVLFSLH